MTEEQAERLITALEGVKDGLEDIGSYILLGGIAVFIMVFMGWIL